MTPPAAATVAGRRVARDPEPEYIPKAPRRVSGAVRQPQARPEPRTRARPATRPSSRATAAAAALEATLAPAPSRTRREAPAPAPRRRQAPARTRSTTQRRPRTHTAPRLAVRLQAPRLDRIVRGRAWIPVLGVLLVAIVGLRVEVLKLGSSVGSQIQQATLLQSSNSELRTQISALSDNQRITTLAERYGMHMPNPLDIHILQAAAGTHVQAAIRNISAPSNSTFLSALATEQQASQQSTNAIAALNGASVTSTNNTNTSSATGTGTGAGSTPSTGTGSQLSTGTTGTTGTTGGQASSAGTGVTGGSNASTSPSTVNSTATGASAPPASSTGGGTTSSGTTGSGSLNTGAAGGAATSNTSQTAGTTGSANGGSGLAG